MSKLNLRGLHRRSLCCHAPLLQVYAENSRVHIDVYDLLKCNDCGDKTHKFEVVNELGERIWPLDHLPMPPAAPRKPRKKTDDGLDPAVDFHKVHLPSGIKLRTVLKG